jgi:hypothetical protein
MDISVLVCVTMPIFIQQYDAMQECILFSMVLFQMEVSKGITLQLVFLGRTVGNLILRNLTHLKRCPLGCATPITWLITASAAKCLAIYCLYACNSDCINCTKYWFGMADHPTYSLAFALSQPSQNVDIQHEII